MNIFNGIKACREAKANGADIALYIDELVK
jgi:hypothetical protein